MSYRVARPFTFPCFRASLHPPPCSSATGAARSSGHHDTLTVY